MPKILIIEDEKELNKVLTEYLLRAGYEVHSSYTGSDGLSFFKQARPDLILLDLNLPRMDGLDVIREIRKIDQTPVIMTTARVEEIDRLIGLELGADDYVIKPYSPREVVARVKAVLRRIYIPPTTKRIITAGSLEIDLSVHAVTLRSVPLELTPAEFNLLSCLAAIPNNACDRLELLEAMQGSSFEGYERTVDMHVMNLRNKLRKIDPHHNYIETIFGFGYRFNPSET